MPTKETVRKKQVIKQICKLIEEKLNDVDIRELKDFLIEVKETEWE